MNIFSTSASDIQSRLGRTSGLLAINGNDLHFEVAGRGIPLVFLHDGLADSRGFGDQFQHFANDLFMERYFVHGWSAR